MFARCKPVANRRSLAAGFGSLGIRPLEVAVEGGAGDAEPRGHISLGAVHGPVNPANVCAHRGGQREIILKDPPARGFLIQPVKTW
jgi:hypothetical protein